MGFEEREGAVRLLTTELSPSSAIMGFEGHEEAMKPLTIEFPEPYIVHGSISSVISSSCTI